MSRLVAILCVVCLALAAAGCPKNTGTGPTPQDPKLVAVKFIGQEICGPYTDFQSLSYAFTCNGLPSTVPSGWRLTPARVPSVADPTRSHPNRIVVLTVSGGSGTELDVEIPYPSGNHPLLTQVAPPKEPGEVAIRREVGVTAADDSNAKTWTVTVNVGGCADMRHLQFFDRAGTPPVRKGPLDVYFFRNPGDDDCAGGGSYAGGSGTPGGSVIRTGPAEPVRDSPTGPCPGDAPRKLFNVCENCASGHPVDANTWTGYEGCSWQEVLDVFGYTEPASTKAQLCTIRQASREDCEGPP